LTSLDKLSDPAQSLLTAWFTDRQPAAVSLRDQPLLREVPPDFCTQALSELSLPADLWGYALLPTHVTLTALVQRSCLLSPRENCCHLPVLLSTVPPHNPTGNGLAPLWAVGALEPSYREKEEEDIHVGFSHFLDD
jgi:hypothetical protein